MVVGQLTGWVSGWLGKWREWVSGGWAMEGVGKWVVGQMEGVGKWVVGQLTGWVSG